MTAHISRPFTTLPELLLSRSTDGSTADIHFLDAEGNITNSLSCLRLLADSREYAARLVSAGLKTDGTDIVITSFSDHESHIRAFWACCLAGIPICPIPPLHPDQSRQSLLFEHLQKLFNKPTLISTDEAIHAVLNVAPFLKTLSTSQLGSLSADQHAYMHVFPHRTPSPDDIVCLMLTSGSTGNSKAASLRHSNLLSCVRGKIAHHKTTSSSRLLNWIAFDHVACVSEIHLQALAANASQYHIAPSAIIRTPRNLLNFCSKYRITYTFSPNFLLAQICRDIAVNPYETHALDLSSVEVFISGGEAVPVKTAVEFTDILEKFGAPRDVLRGGFGMTETGAGCIYDTRPIPRDVQEFNVKYLSLGRCCPGTSVRVVDSWTGVVCQPLGEGQLQLKGPTIFRGYYNNDKATADSFSDGWFITGDTAALDADGNLHLVGRDKDCVIINGVKHPSVDVENYVEDLGIGGLMKSFVYVCPMRLPNADTETYAVLYQHQLEVENPLSASDLKSIAATSRSIRTACAVFCSQAPHIVLPLPRKSFVKTALGKISRSALVAAYLKGEYKIVEESLVVPEQPSGPGQDPKDAVEEIVFQCTAATFDRDLASVNRTVNLFDMGASSMHLMQFKQRLKEQLSLEDIPTIDILKRPELGELSDFLSGLLAHPSGAPKLPLSIDTYNPLVCLNSVGKKPPLFLIHPGVGEVLIFISLARLLADDRPVYALRARGFDADQIPFASFDEMVQCYTSAIEGAYPEGPYYIAGYSFGGAVAFEIGKKLVEGGKRVAWVGIMNLPPHIQFRMKELDWVEILVNICMFLSLIPTSSFAEIKHSLEKEFPEAVGVDCEPSSALGLVQWMFDHCDQERLRTLQLKKSDFRRWVGVAYSICYSGRRYEPAGCVDGALLTVFCAIPLPSMGTKEDYKQRNLAGWREFSRSDEFEMVDVDGEHYSMISEDHVHSFAEKLRGALGRAEARFLEQTPLTTQEQNLNGASVKVHPLLIEHNFATQYTRQDLSAGTRHPSPLELKEENGGLPYEHRGLFSTFTRRYRRGANSMVPTRDSKPEGGVLSNIGMFSLTLIS